MPLAFMEVPAGSTMQDRTHKGPNQVRRRRAARWRDACRGNGVRVCVHRSRHTHTPVIPPRALIPALKQQIYECSLCEVVQQCDQPAQRRALLQLEGAWNALQLEPCPTCPLGPAPYLLTHAPYHHAPAGW